MIEWAVIAFLFGLAALAVFLFCVYIFAKMVEEDVMDLLGEDDC